MGHPPTNKHTLDRIDNSVGYFPGNCRWATRKEQTLNRNKTIFVNVHGERLCLKDAAIKLGAKHKTVSNRYQMGWPIGECLCPVNLGRNKTVASVGWDPIELKFIEP
jgi:hypothetical protein